MANERTLNARLVKEAWREGALFLPGGVGENGTCGTDKAISLTREESGAVGEMGSIRPHGANIVHLWSHN